MDIEDEQNSIISAQESKLNRFKHGLAYYKKRKSERTTKAAISMEALLQHDTMHSSDLDSKIPSALYANTPGTYIFIDGNLELTELDLDTLESNEIDGLIVSGNLIVHGGIKNFERDYGPSLIVSGDTQADYLIGGGSEIHLRGKSLIHSFIIGHYNHGIIGLNDTKSLIEINDDHHSEISGDIVYAFKSNGFSEDYFYTELAKVFGEKASFVEKHTHEEDEIEYEFDTYSFFNELTNHDDISYLDKIAEHFEKRLVLLKEMSRSSKEKDQEGILKVKEELKHYVIDNTEAHNIEDHVDDSFNENEDGNYDEINDDEFSYLNFEMYEFSDLDKLNNDIEESQIFNQSKFQYIKMLFNKRRLAEFGTLKIKIDKMITTDFKQATISNKQASLTEIKRFKSVLVPMHKKQIFNNLITLLMLLGGLWFFPHLIILYILIGFGLFSLIKKVNAYRGIKQWFFHAKLSVELLTETNDEANKNDENEFKHALEFIKFASTQDKNDWSVKLFDWIANLIKGNKE